MSELMRRSAGDLAAMVSGGEVSSRELVQDSLEAIAARGEELGCFIEVDGEGALAIADTIGADDPRPFAGVPIAIKNNVAVEGLRLTMGCEPLRDFRPDHDAFLVRRLREAGFVIVATTKLPEFGILPTTEPRAYGPARNPWDTSRTPGGSSGGSASAVAAGLVPLAHGNDGGGSIRIPAACCGLVGLKPSRGRVSRGPEMGDSFLVCDGVLTRTVAETAALLDILAGPEPGDATWAPPPAEPFAGAVTRDPGRLRIAMSKEHPLGGELDPECERVWRETGELLASLGHEVVEAGPPIPQEGMLELFSGSFGPQVALGIMFAEMIAGRELGAQDAEPLSLAIKGIADSISSTQALAVEAQLTMMSRGIVAFHDDHDVLLTPALAERPLPIGECDGQGEQPMADFARSGRFTPYTALGNVTGQPAISVPVGHGDDGLPTGVQLIAAPLGEHTLLALAAQLEQARPWADRAPGAART